jgi:hypothetical protein
MHYDRRSSRLIEEGIEFHRAEIARVAHWGRGR